LYCFAVILCGFLCGPGFAGAGCFHGGSQETGGATGFGFGFFTA